MSFPENVRDIFKSTDNMREWQGFGRFNSPVQSPVLITLATNIDCSRQHIFYFSAPAVNTSYAVSLNNMTEGQTISVVVASSGTAYSLAWTGVKWNAIGVPTPTAVSSKYDLYSFMKIGNMVFGSCLLQMS